MERVKRSGSTAFVKKGEENDDDDLEEVSLKLTVKCPITTTRIVVPSKGKCCSHIQCFDLEVPFLPHSSPPLLYSE